MSQNERDGRSLAGEGKKLVTGEEELWFQIAEAIGCTPDEAKHVTTASGFVRWQAYFAKKVNRFHREDSFFAQIAFEVYLLRKAWCGLFPGEKPREFDDFLHEFKLEVPKPVVKPSELTPEQRAERIRQLKLAAGISQREIDGLPPLEKPKYQTRRAPGKRKSV